MLPSLPTLSMLQGISFYHISSRSKKKLLPKYQVVPSVSKFSTVYYPNLVILSIPYTSKSDLKITVTIIGF